MMNGNAARQRMEQTLGRWRARGQILAPFVDRQTEWPDRPYFLRGLMRVRGWWRGASKEMLTDKYKIEDGVACESCHGPCGDYWKMEGPWQNRRCTSASWHLSDRCRR
jgi:hypothetical protein